jgi:topoisomerase-4 subunit A
VIETLDLFSDIAPDDAEPAEQVNHSVPPEPPPPDLPPPLPPLPDDALPLDLFAEQAYLAYAMSVVKSRALPQVEDGQKPVQRRILYAMNEMGLRAGAKHVKSARVVGDVLGKLHPHGDSSVYDAMVRIAQDFSLRYPLADGQGNFGSRDGDGAAAMRYTEIRLTPIADLLLSEIDRGTVDFRPNYDGSFEEPVLLPARLPFALLNGASGIAVGMATEMPPHNLKEVAEAAMHLIRDPEATLEELMAHIPGPDYPGGGQIISPSSAIRDAYQTGRGSLRLRARWRIEELARGQWRVIVTELPHGISVAHVMSEIESITNPQPRSGRKDLTQDQKNLKAAVLAVLDVARDESSDKEMVRLLLEPKSSRLDPAAFMAVLLANTSMETSASINMTMIGLDGNPQQKNLKQILAEWVDFRFITVERRTRFRLGEVDRRIHILDGRMIAFLRIEEVIKVIRESDEPKIALMETFNLTATQAEDILEIRLRQLARLEGIKIEKELAELRTERDALQTLLDSRSAMTRAILKEIESDAKKHGDARRTLIEAVAQTNGGRSDANVNVPDEPVTVILSKAGWLRSRQGHGIDAASISYKTGDGEFAVMETRTTWPLVLIDTNGRAYTIPVAAIPGGKGDGVPLPTLVDLQEGGKIAQAISTTPESKFLFSGAGGYGFIAAISDLVGRNKSGKGFMTMEKGEAILPPAPAIGSHIYAVSSDGRLVVFDAAEMKELGKGRGVMIMGPEDGCVLAKVNYCDGQCLVLPCKERGKVVQLKLAGEEFQKYLLHRARKGRQLPGKKMPV